MPRARTLAAAALLATLVAGVAGVAAGPAPVPAQGLRVRAVIDASVAQPAQPWEAFDTFALNFADLRGDGHLELVSLNDNLHTYVLDPLTGHILADLTTPHGGLEGWKSRDINGVAIGDVTGDGVPELAVLNGAANLTLFALDPNQSSADHLEYAALWQRTVYPPDVDPSFYPNHPWYANGSVDLGADGNPTIVHLPDGQALVAAQSDGFPLDVAYDRDGKVAWWTDFWDGNSGPWSGTFAGSTRPQVVFGTDGGQVVDYDAAAGTIQWVFDIKREGVHPGSVPVAPTVVNLDGTSAVFVGARSAVDDGPGWINRSHAVYYLIDEHGLPLWHASFLWGNPLVYMHPAVADVNGDGVKDLIVQDWNTVGHNPGQWNSTGKANLFALDGRDGSLLWRAQVMSPWSNKGIAVADFLPGRGPVIAVEELRGPLDGIALYSLQGKPLDWYPLPGAGWSITRGPVLADLDGDGHVELVVPVARGSTGCPRPLDVGCRQGAFVVYATAATDSSVLAGGNDLFDSQQTQSYARATASAPPSLPAPKLTLGPAPAVAAAHPSPGFATTGTLLAIAALTVRRRTTTTR